MPGDRWSLRVIYYRQRTQSTHYRSNMRTTGQRKMDAIDKLEGDLDVWVATANDQGVAHLVPLSLCWHGGEVIVATEFQSRTARNVTKSAQARLALGSSRDVVMIDASASVVDTLSADPAIVHAYSERTGWDPGGEVGSWVYVRLRPRKVQVWREVDEIAGRTVMRDGTWLS